VLSTSLSSISFYNNQSASQTAAFKETQFSTSLDSTLLDNKIKSITAGLQDNLVNLLKKQSSQNAEIIADYVLAMNIEVNPQLTIYF